MCQGAVVLDKNGVIIWISKGYCSLLKQQKDDLLGKKIQEVVPTTQLDRVIQTGKPNLVDLMQINEVWCAVTRLPLRDSDGNITGAVGFIYYDELERLQPMFDKFSLLRRKYETQILDRTTRYSFDDMIGQSLPLNTLKNRPSRLLR
ncbi:PAS domain-containing protein [Aliamphritea spongicola]|nr:PAS domain-containing protein [Aliamphritea spongicola]